MKEIEEIIKSIDYFVCIYYTVIITKLIGSDLQ